MPAYLLIHNPRETLENPAEGMMLIRAQKTTITGGWSVGKAFSIAPGDRLFFYRSTVEPRGIFAVGVALPADIPEAREWRGVAPVPVKPGLAVFEAPHWRNPRKNAFYINAEWQMMSDPTEGRVLIPFERLRGEEPFSRVFTKTVKGLIRGHAPQASGSPINDADVANALYEECAKEFPVVLREYGDTPLHIAAWSNAPEIKSLLKDGVNLMARNKHGLAALDMAAQANSAEAIAALVGSGADVNAPGEGGFTAIFEAVLGNAREAVSKLAEFGASVKARAENGVTPMHSAAMGNSADAIAELAKLGADIDAKDHEGLTPMHTAAMDNAEKAITKLAKLGADVNSRDDNGRTPLDDAEAGQMKEAADLLRKLGGKRGAEL